MANYAYERLSAQDASFLLFETPNEHMHLAWMWAFETGPLASRDGGVDIARIRKHVASRLYLFPRFRQKLAYTPVEKHPVWIDDDSFQLNYHVQHVALPDPGDAGRLWAKTSALLSQPLDASKPLWELWIIEGLANGGFAIVSKTHHCMVDGRTSVDLMSGLLDDHPDAPEQEPDDWIPRPAPDSSDLLLATLRDRASLAVSFGSLPGQLAGLGQALVRGLERAPSCPINQPIGPHRLAGGARFPRAEMAEAAERLGGSIDDLALTVVAGGVAAYLKRRGFDTNAAPLRMAMPAGAGKAPSGTATASLTSLPTNLEDPVSRMAALVTARREADEEAPTLAHNANWLRFAEAAGHSVLGLGVEIRRWLHSFNLIVSILPGPDEPRYLLGSKLIASYPQIPLFQNQCLSVGVASYAEHIHIGLAVDWEVIPDLALLTSDLQDAYREAITASRAASGDPSPAR